MPTGARMSGVCEGRGREKMRGELRKESSDKADAFQSALSDGSSSIAQRKPM